MDVTITVDGTTHSFPKSVLRTSPIEFSIVGLGLLADDEAGPHEVEIGLDYDMSFPANPEVHDEAVVWLLDSPDIPTGVTFSPATLADQVFTITP